MEWAEAIGRVITGEDLSYDESYWVMDQVMDGELGDVRLASFLTAMVTKGTSIAEIRGLADAMRDHAEPIAVSSDALDIVGTGGDRARTVNISTMASMVLAGAGVPVVKHGNRAATSASGSADVLEALGVNLDLAPERVAEVFDEVGITFLFATKFHPSMRHAAGVRRALAFPTVFNILGPLTNPARPRASAVGVAQAANAPLMAGVFAERGQSALVFRGKDRGLDELTTTEVNSVWSVAQGSIDYTEIDAVAEFGLAPSLLEDLRGADAAYNARVVRDLVEGQRGPVRDTVILNAAAGLAAWGVFDGTKASDGSITERMRRGIDLATDAIDSGATTSVLQRWIDVSNA